LTPRMVSRAVDILIKANAPMIGNNYVAVVHPSVAGDLRRCPDWISINEYNSSRNIFNGEIGELHGVRFIVDTFAPVLGTAGETSADDDEYVNKERGRTYATYFLGNEGYAIIDPEGGHAQMIIKDKSDIGGPLDQYSTIGYKFETNGATILYPERVLRVMSCSSYSATDSVN
nr:N4-gp56 family major capsid protein [Oscillospiraceae bacterium]